MTVSQSTETVLSSIFPIWASKMVTNVTVTPVVSEKDPNPLDGQAGRNP
jgi:hypothetical protein